MACYAITFLLALTCCLISLNMYFVFNLSDLFVRGTYNLVTLVSVSLKTPLCVLSKCNRIDFFKTLLSLSCCAQQLISLKIGKFKELDISLKFTRTYLLF